VKKKIFLFLIFFCLGSFFLVGLALAQNYGIDAVAGEAGLKFTTNIQTLIGNVIGAILSFVGVIFFALMLYGGITWMTSVGNQENQKKAITTIVSAVIGLIIVLSAYAITSFVFGDLIDGSSISGTGVSKTTSDSFCSIECGGDSHCLEYDKSLIGNAELADIILDQKKCLNTVETSCAVYGKCSRIEVYGEDGEQTSSCPAPPLCSAGEETTDYCACIEDRDGDEDECALSTCSTCVPLEGCAEGPQSDNYCECMTWVGETSESCAEAADCALAGTPPETSSCPAPPLCSAGEETTDYCACIEKGEETSEDCLVTDCSICVPPTNCSEGQADNYCLCMEEVGETSESCAEDADCGTLWCMTETENCVPVPDDSYCLNLSPPVIGENERECLAAALVYIAEQERLEQELKEAGLYCEGLDDPHCKNTDGCGWAGLAPLGVPAVAKCVYGVRKDMCDSQYADCLYATPLQVCLRGCGGDLRCKSACRDEALDVNTPIIQAGGQDPELVCWQGEYDCYVGL